MVFFNISLPEMKTVLTILLCIIYTTVSFGGTVYMHNCCGETKISLNEKKGHDVCPLCAKKQKKAPHPSKHKSCTDGKCSDIEIKIDQLSDKLFSGNSSFSFQHSPAILTRLWINLKPLALDVEKECLPWRSNFVYSDTSPPTFLLNCIFRI